MRCGVCVVTVTYASRWELLHRMLTTTLEHDPRVRRIVVVDNGSAYDVADFVQKEGHQRVTVLRLPCNEGSAGGFALGIDTAVGQQDCEFIWLLDDDNIPMAGSLARLMDEYVKLGNDWHNAMLALRAERSRGYRLALLGLMDVRIPINSFAGFHLGLILEKIVRRLRERQINKGMATQRRRPLVRVGFAPYGGLLLHRELVRVIGLPRADYFLYEDHEYTTRIPLHGGNIYLCADAEVHDLETSWNLQPTRVHFLFNQKADLGRLYFTVRNRVQLEVSRFVRNRLMYWLNVTIYLGLLIVQSLFLERQPKQTLQRVRLILRAVRDGAAGRLGKDMPVELSGDPGTRRSGV